MKNHPGVSNTQKSSSFPRKFHLFPPVWAREQRLTWLSSTVLLVTSMVTATSMSGSRGHRESRVGFVVGLWIMCTVTAGVACTSKDAAPFGMDLERNNLGSETKSPNLELNPAVTGREGPRDHPWLMKCPWSSTRGTSVAALGKPSSRCRSGTSGRGLSLCNQEKFPQFQRPVTKPHPGRNQDGFHANHAWSWGLWDHPVT